MYSKVMYPGFWRGLGLLLFAAGVLASPVRAADGVMITEFLAGNVSTLADEDGEFSDWVEIYNSGTNSVNLIGYYLTDSTADLRKWRFPALSLGPFQYAVVFASGKNRALPCSELHANFTLNQAGEYLALVSPDGVTVASAFSPAFPAQEAGVSFGLQFQITTNSLVAKGAGSVGGAAPQAARRLARGACRAQGSLT